MHTSPSAADLGEYSVRRCLSCREVQGAGVGLGRSARERGDEAARTRVHNRDVQRDCSRILRDCEPRRHVEAERASSRQLDRWRDCRPRIDQTARRHRHEVGVLGEVSVRIRDQVCSGSAKQADFAAGRQDCHNHVGDRLTRAVVHVARVGRVSPHGNTVRMPGAGWRGNGHVQDNRFGRCRDARNAGNLKFRGAASCRGPRAVHPYRCECRATAPVSVGHTQVPALAAACR